jgi:hypothetical protein
MLDIQSQSQGVLIPRMNTLQRNGINNPADALMIFNTDSSCFEFFVATDWINLCSFSGVENDTATPQQIDNYPRMIGYGGGLGGSSRNIMRNAFQDEDVLVLYTSAYFIHVHSAVSGIERRDIRNDNANASLTLNSVVINGSLYLLLYDDVLDEYLVYQYDVYDINSGGVLVTVLGQQLGQLAPNIVMTSNGTDMYFSNNAGNTSNYYEIARYSISSSTTFTYQNTITCNTSSGLSYGFMVDNDQVIYVLGTDGYVYVYDNAGTFISAEGDYGTSSSNAKSLNWNNRFYFGRSNIDKIMNRVYIKY